MRKKSVTFRTKLTATGWEVDGIVRVEAGWEDEVVVGAATLPGEEEDVFLLVSDALLLDNSDRIFISVWAHATGTPSP